MKWGGCVHFSTKIAFLDSPKHADHFEYTHVTLFRKFENFQIFEATFRFEVKNFPRKTITVRACSGKISPKSGKYALNMRKNMRNMRF